MASVKQQQHHILSIGPFPLLTCHWRLSQKLLTTKHFVTHQQHTYTFWRHNICCFCTTNLEQSVKWAKRTKPVIWRHSFKTFSFWRIRVWGHSTVSSCYLALDVLLVRAVTLQRPLLGLDCGSHVSRNVVQGNGLC